MTEGALKKWESARSLLAQAARIDEVAHVRGMAQQAMLYARQVRDRELMAHAMEIQQRAERKLGELLRKAGEMGLISKGGRPRGAAAEKGTFGQALAEAIERAGGEPDEAAEKTSAEAEEVFEPQPFTLADVGIDHKLSAKAQKLAGLDEAAFEAGIARAREKILSGGAAVVNPVKDISTAAKKEARAAREQRLGEKQLALPVKKFGVILTDDEWEHLPWSEAGLGKAAVNHYPVSNIDELKKRDISSLAADDAVLWMWSTVPHLDQALELMRHRGFAYKSQFIWRKVYPGAQQGMGYWARINHEILLVGTRGNVPAPAPGTQWGSVVEAPVGEHSQKPDIFYELIEAYFPTLPKIELNARRRREGWDAWGLEAPVQPEDVAGGNILAESGLSHAKPGEEAPEAPAQPEDNSESRAPAGGPVEAGGAVPSASPASPADSDRDLVAAVLALRPDCLVPECCRSPGGRALCHSCAKAKERGSVDLPAFLPPRPAETEEAS